jgi:hypothetical protein
VSRWWRSEYGSIAAIAIFVIVILLVLVIPALRNWVTENITASSPVPDWIAVAALGGLVGLGELIARYKDAPFRAVLTLPAFLYVVINVVAAIGALFLIRAFGWEFGIGGQQDQPPSEITVRITQVMVAGLGAMALFRSSLFITRIGGQDVGVGPSSFLSIMLKACDDGVDRERAKVRADWVNQIMTGIAYTKARDSLVEVSARLLRNFPGDKLTDLRDSATAIGNRPMTERAKALNLGLLIMNEVGLGALKGAVEALGSTIKSETPTIKILRPTEGAKYQINEVVQAAYFCETDPPEKGLRSQQAIVTTVPDGRIVATPADGQPIDTSTVGDKTFSVTAEDEDGNKNTVSRAYQVVDTEKPKLILPDSISANATDANGAKVTFDVNAIDDDPPKPEVICTPASGSTFPIGESTITCTATDRAGNEAKGSFKVIVTNNA